MWQHVFPVNDLFPHNLGQFEGEEWKYHCDCNPYIDHESKLIIHHAFSGLDLIAEVEGSQIIQRPDGLTMLGGKIGKSGRVFYK